MFRCLEHVNKDPHCNVQSSQLIKVLAPQGHVHCVSCYRKAEELLCCALEALRLSKLLPPTWKIITK